MAGHPATDSYVNVAAQIREAALDAIKDIQGAHLGDGQIAEIIRQTSSAQLSKAERATRVASLAITIAEEYKKQPVNISAAPNAQATQQNGALGFKGGIGGMGHYGLHAGGGGSADARRAGAGSGRELDSITVSNYGGTEMAHTGLHYASFNAMRKEGFNAHQIIDAVNTNKELGLGANTNPAAIARLKRDVPSAIPGLHATRDHWLHVHDLEKTERAARARGDHATADQIKNQISPARQAAEEHDKKEQERVRELNPARVPDVRDKQREIRRSIEHQAAKLGVDPKVIEGYRRHPQDAAARQAYDELKKKAEKDPAKRAALAKLEKDTARMSQITKEQRSNNEVELAANEAKAKEGDDMLAALNGDSPAKQPEKRAETTTKPKFASVTAKTDQKTTKTAGTQGHTKTASAKTIAPST